MNYRRKIMRNTSVLGLALVATFVAPLLAGAVHAAEAASPFIGDWTATAVAPTGNVSETLKVVKTAEGYAITAKLVVPDPNGNPEAGPGTDIVLNGNNFVYKRTVTVSGGAFVITYSGVVSGDTFTGEIDLGPLGKVPYNGVRISQ
jgi:hypothetical protein